MRFPLVPLKFGATLNGVTLPETTSPDHEIRYCEISDISYGKTISWPEPIAFKEAPSRARRVVRPGDTLVSTVRTYLKAISTADIAPCNAVASTGFATLTPANHLEPRFLKYAVLSDKFVFEVSRRSTGVSYPAITPQELGRIPIHRPAIEVQRTIADYLDHETAEIDALIGDLEGTLSLLTRRWDTELIRCVQTGVEGEAHATGVSTWPRAPQTWRRTRLKATATSARNGAWGAEPDTDETTVRCIRVADFDKTLGSVHNASVTSRSYPAGVVAANALRPGDLILEKSGGGPTTPVGNVVRYDGPGGEMYSNFVARIEVASGVDSSYALRLHQSLYTSGVTTRSVKQTTGIQNLDATSYFNEPIFLPTLAEQQQIAKHLDSRRLDMDELSTDFTRAIDLAKERRAALITAAVTGQIDVTAKNRPAAERLEDDIKELS